VGWQDVAVAFVISGILARSMLTVAAAEAEAKRSVRVPCGRAQPCAMRGPAFEPGLLSDQTKAGIGAPLAGMPGMDDKQ
jgi:hypothetical protein